MTDAELWHVIWRALRMIEQAIARRYGFGEFNPKSTNYKPPENVVE